MHPSRKSGAESRVSANGSLGKGVLSWMVEALVTTLTLTRAVFSWKPFASEWDRHVGYPNAPEALISRCPPPTDHDEIRLFEPLRPTFLGFSGTPLPTELQILF